MDRSTKIGMIFLGLFALPFAIFGLVAVTTGIRTILDGGPSQSWMLVAFGLVFSAIGFGLLAGVILGPRKLQAAKRRQAENPEQPWLWREDWAQGRANSQTKSEMIRAWIFAVLWNLLSTPILFAVPKTQLEKQPASLVVLAFPLVGVALLIWAARETLRWFEFGKTSFEMSAVPCVIGREVRGNIQARFPRPPGHPIQLKLSCLNRVVTNTGNHQNTQEKILWQEQKTVSPDDLFPGPMGMSIPVRFHVPVDARATETKDPKNSILWQLEAAADVPGVDYEDIFELPVFRTKDTPSTEQEDDSDDAPATFTPTIRVGTTPDGRTEFYFPPARNAGFASGLTTFAALWGGMLWFLIAKRAPFIFPLLFGVFELFMLYGSLQLWLGTSTVIVGSGELQVRSGILGMGGTRQIAFGDVAGIQTAITAQQGGGSGTPFYDIQLIQTNGTIVTLGKTLRNKCEAESLATEMKRLITPAARSMAASTGR